MTSRAGQLLTSSESPRQHELAVSAYLLMQTAFTQPAVSSSTASSSNKGARDTAAATAVVVVNGVDCRDRLDCLLRVIEHEMVVF
jgi:hypothetical protein